MHNKLLDIASIKGQGKMTFITMLDSSCPVAIIFDFPLIRPLRFIKHLDPGLVPGVQYIK
jgi:6-phosphogluconate dehydrogenase